MADIPSVVTLIIKAFVLVALVVYLIFSLLMYLNVRKLNNFVLITYSHLNIVIPLLFFLHLLLVISLFFLALGIL